MSDANDTAETDDIEEIKQRKKEELLAQAGEDERAEGRTEPVHVETHDHLGDLVADHDVVLADFYADWCGPCQMLEPTVEAVADETSAVVAKVDVDKLQSLAQQYQVQGVPTLILFADGEKVERLVGMQDRETLFGLVRQHT